MGYKPQPKVYELAFTDYPGLEIQATSTALGKLLQLGQLNLKLDEQDEEKRMRVFNMFSSVLVSWNVEHPTLTEDSKNPENMTCAECGLLEGEPMPCTVQSLMCLELSFIMSIIFGWMAAISRASVPKELSLSNGVNNSEELMRQLAQHQNLSPLPMPNLS